MGEMLLQLAEITRNDLGFVLGLWIDGWVEDGKSRPTRNDKERIRGMQHGYASNDNVCCYTTRYSGGINDLFHLIASAHGRAKGNNL